MVNKERVQKDSLHVLPVVIERSAIFISWKMRKCLQFDWKLESSSTKSFNLASTTQNACRGKFCFKKFLTLLQNSWYLLLYAHYLLRENKGSQTLKELQSERTEIKSWPTHISWLLISPMFPRKIKLGIASRGLNNISLHLCCASNVKNIAATGKVVEDNRHVQKVAKKTKTSWKIALM